MNVKHKVLLSGMALVGLVSLNVFAAEESVKVAIVEATNLAPTLGQAKGRLLVSTGKAYQTAKSNMILPVGSKMIAAADASALLTYNNGCVKQIKPNTMVTIGTEKECVAGSMKEKIYVANNGNDSGLGVPPQNDRNFIADNALGLLGLAGSIAAVAIISNDGDSRRDISAGD
jgi:hypothetical protein